MWKPPPRDITDQHERADHAKKISGEQESDHRQSAPVRPGEDPRKIHRAKLWAKKPIQQNSHRQKQHDDLHSAPDRFGTQATAENRNSEQIKKLVRRLRTQTHLPEQDGRSCFRGFRRLGSDVIGKPEF